MTQHQKVIFTMLRGPRGKWWHPQDFMRDGSPELFVGYEASARLSELAHDYPEMIESRNDGKQKVRRIKTSDVELWLPLLPKYLRYAIKEEFSHESN